MLILIIIILHIRWWFILSSHKFNIIPKAHQQNTSQNHNCLWSGVGKESWQIAYVYTMLCVCYRCKFYMANICLAHGIASMLAAVIVASYALPGTRKVAVAIFQRGQTLPRSIFILIQINIHVIRLPVLLSTEDWFLLLAWNRDMAKYRNETILPSLLPPHFFQPPIDFSCIRRVPYQPNNYFSPKQKQQRNETMQKIAVFTKTFPSPQTRWFLSVILSSNKRSDRFLYLAGGTLLANWRNRSSWIPAE